MIEFLLNEEVVALDDFAADLTLLQYLREHRRRTGTKEGCASGDCGACTVVVARSDGEGGLRYASVNSCITFLGALHGCQVITVEDLSAGGELHPVQQALVDHHGSQCGFCTPGFVMSLFALYKQGGAGNRAEVETALAGNLCRCTGYRPIVEAGLSACSAPRPDCFSPREVGIAARLSRIEPAAASADGRFHAPADIDTAARLLVEHPDARPFCGATDLALEVTLALKSLPRLVYLGNVAGLDRIETTADAIVIGAAARYASCFEILSAEYPDLGEILLRLGSAPIRNQGTIGGNLANASPIGDMPPVLIALGARLTLRRGDDRRRVAVEDFFTGYRRTVLEAGEFIETIELPRARAGERLVACKNSKRFDDDISTALGVFLLAVRGRRIERASIAFGGMAAMPKRAPRTEAAVCGLELDAAPAAARTALGEDFSPIDDVRASADYRLCLAGAMFERACLELRHPESIHRVSRYAI